MTIYINTFGLNCALGNRPEEIAAKLFAGDSGLQMQTGWVANHALPVGALPIATLPQIPPFPNTSLIDASQDDRAIYASRNNRVLLDAAQQIDDAVRNSISRFGESRIGIVLGTSTSGIHECERMLSGNNPSYRYPMQEIGSPADFLARYWQITGPAWVVSTACSSSGRAMIAAKRLLEQNLCDAVITGGADTLCRLTLNGFSALDSVSRTQSDPFSEQRNGINIGEGAALFLLSKQEHLTERPAARFLGGGISLDAHHISAPDPQGKGAIKAMQTALQRADLAADAIDYVNLHGTGTHQNDAMEAHAMAQVFPTGVPCSSTKPLTGHTLGAASAIEAAFCLLTLSNTNKTHALPPHQYSGIFDQTLPPIALVRQNERLPRPIQYTMSNSFAFGGNNVSLIFGRAL
ncbi:Predicted 3-oxoacyl-(Acyl-carrier-protein) synthase [gamma proteobacterium HdN1]|nr:Predicted 3-oxoacyl-(Acyl-carrier-protein) synthase [gamma proteobacterium HdN1]